MNKIIIPEGYSPRLNRYDTQRAIQFIKQQFETELSEVLGLKRVSAPLFVSGSSGINDDLNGYERPVDFDIPAVGENAQVVHSLAKWKRLALYRYGFRMHQGLYTDMNAIRRDEELDNLHSVYVDQWDWEKVISRDDRNTEYLKSTVRSIVNAICMVSDKLHTRFPALPSNLCRDISFVTTTELENMYPTLTPKERENEYLREHKTAFIMQIGGLLPSGLRHDGRAPDYDYLTQNGEIIYRNDTLDCAFEVSSMGIRVDESSLASQLREAGCEERRDLPFHRMLLSGELPLTIGGGIGQSRLCMLLMGCAHIGEVQSSIWDTQTVNACEQAGIPLL